MQMFFVVVLAILTVISWYGFIRCMVNPNWLRQKGEERTAAVTTRSSSCRSRSSRQQS